MQLPVDGCIHPTAQPTTLPALASVAIQDTKPYSQLWRDTDGA